ncbi:hypothetical protein [Xenorhabdus sp. KK7.4]|nr:hypothetical protein [Xenorhabdus sp. KK7.4]
MKSKIALSELERITLQQLAVNHQHREYDCSTNPHYLVMKLDFF